MSATALAALLAFLGERKYRFVTPTPATHARINRRTENERAQSIRDVFGWSRPFAPNLLPEPLFDTLAFGGIIVEGIAGWQSLVRASSLDEDVFLHSAFPTSSADAVFFGPDTYRFARAIKANLSEPRLVRRALDLGCGSGAGGVVLAKNSICRELVLSDINTNALQLACANAKAAGVHDVRTTYSDLFDQLDGEFDLIVANPPYLNDPLHRTYRHGGGAFGSDLSLRIALGAKEKLASGGSLLLYTGSPVVAGVDHFKRAILQAFSSSGLLLSYEEIDPDVFGEELEGDEYRQVDRIAVVVLTVQRPEVRSC
jgi:release factor glutamine methyltransferase